MQYNRLKFNCAELRCAALEAPPLPVRAPRDTEATLPLPAIYPRPILRHLPPPFMPALRRWFHPAAPMPRRATLPLPAIYSAIYPPHPPRYTEATLPLPADFSSGMQGGMMVADKPDKKSRRKGKAAQVTLTLPLPLTPTLTLTITLGQGRAGNPDPTPNPNPNPYPYPYP